MVLSITAGCDLQQASGGISKAARAKSLIMKAWRERWTEVQWGINIRQLADAGEDGSFLSECILQQALSGPGPNSLVLSYLMYSINAQIVTTSSVLSSVSKYDAFHKPFCVASLLDLLDSIKEQIIMNDHQGKEDCIQLALSLQAVVCWLLSCMYSSLETLSDLISDFPAEAEDSKIVIKCRNLIDFFLTDPYLFNLIQVANKEDEASFLKIQRMSKEVDTFAEGHHQKDISHVRTLIEKLSAPKVLKSSPKITSLHQTRDGLQMKVGNPSIQAILMKAVLFKPSQDMSITVSELVLVKQLQSIDSVNFYSEVLHSCMMGLVDAFGKKEHDTFVGFAFLQLSSLMAALREKLNDSGTDLFVKGVETFLNNESCLNIADAKLHCCVFEFILNSFMKLGLINESDKKNLLKIRTSKAPSSSKQGSGSPPVVVRAETTIMPNLLKTLDGDFQNPKNQESILGVLYELISSNEKIFNAILTASATTGKWHFTSKLIRLNQLSRQIGGEGSKAANTRAMIFDSTFLMLCYAVQLHGQKALSLSDSDGDSFFEEWYKDCMVENDVAKNPDTILSRCEPNKVDLLMNQYMQGDGELKTSLVSWHELCVNSVGVVRELLTAWESECTTFAEVKRVLDVFRSKVCSLPVCVSAWLCAHIQMTPDEKCDKAREILKYFLQPEAAFENQDRFEERSALMAQIISKMMSCLPSSEPNTPNSPTMYNFESKPVAELYRQCWACMNKRGLVDVETTVNLQHLLNMSGPHCFVENLVNDMLQLQHSKELGQRCDLLFGIFHYDLKNCVPALIRVSIPTILKYWTNESSLLEPQLKALACLAVDSVLVYYYHAAALKVKEERIDDNESEPQAKRRKFMDIPVAQKENLTDLHQMLKDLFEVFENLLKRRTESTPTIVFILQFLEQLSLKSPSPSLLTSLPHQVVSQMISLMAEEMNPETLIGLFCLSNKGSRRNCAQSLCRLKYQIYANEHYEPRARSFSPAPGS